MSRREGNFLDAGNENKQITWTNQSIIMYSYLHKS